MLYDVRTYTVKSGTLKAYLELYEKRLGQPKPDIWACRWRISSPKPVRSILTPTSGAMTAPPSAPQSELPWKRIPTEPHIAKKAHALDTWSLRQLA